MTPSQSFLFVALALCVAQGVAQEEALPRRVVSSCNGLRQALEAQETVSIDIVRSFDCDTSTWNRSVVIERDVRIQGRRRRGAIPYVDWGTSSKNIVAGRGTTVEFQDLIFLQQDMGIGNIDILFFQAEEHATATFDFIVVGVISCPWNLNVSRFEDLERPAAYEGEQVSRQVNRDTVEALDVVLHFTTRNSVWQLRHTFFTCNVFKHDPALNRYYEMSVDNSAHRDANSADEDFNSSDIWRVVVYILGAVGGIAGFLLVLWGLIAWNKRNRDPYGLGYDDDKGSSDYTTGAFIHNKPGSAPENWAMLDSNVTLEEPLGHGEFGKVYRGVWQGTTVAVKVISHNERALKTNVGGPLEAFFAKHISHPNVVQTFQISKRNVATANNPANFFGSPDEKKNKKQGSSRSGSCTSEDMFADFDEEDPGPRSDCAFETWLIIEYCDKGTLNDAVRDGVFRMPGRENHFRMSFVAKTALEIASAMNYLHSVRIIHGDLKTGNVLLKGDGSDRRGFICKVGDFGLSRFLAEDSHIETFTCGAVTHMPPELLKGGHLTSAADVFSFAILLWELLSGKKPHQGKNHGEIILAVVNNAYRPPFPPNVPGDFMELIESCWCQEYMDRPLFPEIIDKLSLMLAKYEKEEGVQVENPMPAEIEKNNTRSSFFSPQDSRDMHYYSERGKGNRLVPKKFSSLKETEAVKVEPTSFLDSNRSLHLSLDGRSDPAEPAIISIPTSRSVGSRVRDKRSQTGQ